MCDVASGNPLHCHNRCNGTVELRVLWRSRSYAGTSEKTYNEGAKNRLDLFYTRRAGEEILPCDILLAAYRTPPVRGED
jgi:hypothetical protein